MASPPRLPPKKDVALALLEQSTVFVHLDPRGEEVRVPPGFKKQPQLVLQVGHNMAPPIPDLDVGEEGISCTLSFNKLPHFCWIPWSAVFALVGGNARGMVWPDDVPREVSVQAAQREESKPALRAVPNKVEPAVARAEPKEEKPKKKRARKTAKEDGKKAARPAAAARPAPVEAKAPAAAPARDATATGTTTAAGDKPRRALPPYLRVIK